MHGVLIPRVLFFAAAVAVCGVQAEAGSIYGRAIQANGSSPTGPCRASLRAEMDRRGAPEADLSGAPEKASFSEPLDQKGTFQILGASPGKYVLDVECPSASSVRGVLVQSSKDTHLDAPLRLEDLTLEIAVTPKLDPDGKPWQLTVDATMPRLRRIVTSATTSSEGGWMRRGMVVGNYRVNISSSDGTAWSQRFFDLKAGSKPFSVDLPFIRVKGEVQLNSQPISARLTFHNDAGGEPMTLTSDDAGFFQGLLPVTPGAQETQWTVEAQGLQPAIRRRLSGVKVHSAGETSAWLDLSLPVFAVHGTVASGTGEAQSGVQVTFENASNGIRSSASTNEMGGFELSELPPGQYTAWAESLDGASEHTPLQVVQGTESELQLVFRPFPRVPFYVISRGGPVADAAVQVWIAPGVPRYFTRTDADGRFEVKLPPGTSDVGLTVGAAGYAVKMSRMKISNEDSSEANTVNLEESSGSLMLDLHPPGRLHDSSATAYLVHGGAIEALGTLADWGIEQAYPGIDGRMIVRALEPGDYGVCFIADPAQLATLWLGSLPLGSCRKGTVARGETLTLSP